MGLRVTPLEAIQRLADTGGRLRSVTAHDFHGDPRLTSHLVLSFEAGQLILSTSAEDDSILISIDQPSMTDCAPRIASLWNPALGRTLLWGWILTNHQGYVDGARFDFRNTVADSPLIIEVLVVASMLHTVVVPGAA